MTEEHKVGCQDDDQPSQKEEGLTILEERFDGKLARGRFLNRFGSVSSVDRAPNSHALT